MTVFRRILVVPCDRGGDQGVGGHDGLGQGGQVGCPQAPAVVVDGLGRDHKVRLGGHPLGVDQGGVGLPGPEEHLEHSGGHQGLGDVHWGTLGDHLQSRHLSSTNS